MREDEELVRVFRYILESCIERKLLLSQIENNYYRESCRALENQFLIHDASNGIIEARIVKIINEKLGN